MPVQEKSSFIRQFSVRSEPIETLQQPESPSERDQTKTETDSETKESRNETPDDTAQSVDEGEESDEEDAEKADPLVPYSIALLHQVLAFLISITNPSK